MNLKWKRRYPEKWRAQASRRREKVKIRIRKIIEDHKLDRPCACGENDLAALDFHHIVPKNGGPGISGAIRGQSFKKLFEEIAKCIVICANCHRKGHAGRPRPEHTAFFEAAQ